MPLSISQVAADTVEFMGSDNATATSIAARLGFGGLTHPLSAQAQSIRPQLIVRPGLEVRSSGDLRLQSDWTQPTLTQAQLLAVPQAGEATITLRAAGDLLVQASLSTGFRPSPVEGAGLVGTSTRAGSIRLVAGADLASVDASALQYFDPMTKGKGSLQIGLALQPGQTQPQAVTVRSTVGRIALAAARDIQLLNSAATLLTLGVPAGLAALAPAVAPSAAPTALAAAVASSTTEPSVGNGASTGVVAPPAAPTAPGQTSAPTVAPTLAPTAAPTLAPTAAPAVVIDPLPATIYQTMLDNLGQNLGSSGISPFTEGGGGITLTAGRDVVGSTPVSSQRYVSDWLWRARTQDMTSAWFARPELFQQGLATLGGGHVVVRAGRDVSHLSAAAASSGFAGLTAEGAAANGSAADRQFGGGSVSVQAGRDVISGQLMASRQALDIKAGGAVQRDATLSLVLDPGLQLIYQDGALRVQSGRDLEVASARNFAYAFASDANTLGQALTLQAQDKSASLLLQSAAGSVSYEGAAQLRAFGGSDALAQVLPIDLRVLAPHGGVTLGTALQWSAVADPSLARTWVASQGDLKMSNFEVLALGAGVPDAGSDRLTQDLLLSESRTLTRDALGQAQLDQTGRAAALFVSGQADLLLQGALISARPVELRAARDVRVAATGSLAVQHQVPAAGQPVETTVVKAGRDLIFSAGSSNSGIDIAGPGELLVLAGRDVDLGGGRGLVASGNLANGVLLPARGSNVTVVAGLRDDGLDYQSAAQLGFHVLGASGLSGKQGQAYALLGGKLSAAAFDQLDAASQLAALRELIGTASLDVGLASYVRGLPARASVSEQRLRMASSLGKGLNDAAVDEALKLAGNLLEPAWSALSAAQALQVFAGLPVAQQAQAMSRLLLGQLSTQTAAQRIAILQALADPVQLAALVSFVQRASGESLDTAQALARFEALPVERQMPLLNRMLIGELRTAGRAASQLDGDERWARYASGYLAIDLLFPQGRPAATLRMPTSQIKTMQAADITVLNLGGGANAGEVAATGAGKKATELGLVTVNGGNISTVVRGNFEVNQSRVFTLGQGDVLMWSSAGNIDAGRGAKTVSGAPAPVLRLDEQGRLVFDTSGSFSGSGIAVLNAGSNLDLYAPTGEINAGEAGIRAKGNAFLGAERLVNANDIQVAGNRSGVVPAVVANVAISLPASEAISSASATGVTSDKDEDERKRGRSRRQILLEFLGFGASN